MGQNRDVPRPLRVIALVKQIPAFEAMELGTDGRLVREGLPREMSAYCRRAVAQGVALAESTGGSCTVLTMGPPSAEEVLREAICCGADRGIVLTDPAFAGADTLATARTLAAALRRLDDQEGPADLVLAGRSSVDGETGQVGPQLAELLDLPFASPVRRLDLLADGSALRLGLELDDSWAEVEVTLPAVLGCAERLIDPCKIKDPARWAEVDERRIERWSSAELGAGPWGAEASPTWVGRTRVETVQRACVRAAGDAAAQVDVALAVLRSRGLFATDDAEGPAAPVVESSAPTDASAAVAVVVEPGRPRLARELLGAAAALADGLGGRVVAVVPLPSTSASDRLVSWGADRVVELAAAQTDDLVDEAAALAAEEVAAGLVRWARDAMPSVLAVPGTVWGREVAARAAAALGAGLVGDAIAVELDGTDHRLVAWKPAFGGALVAEVRARSPIQMVTIRPGVLGLRRPRGERVPEVERLVVDRRHRIRVLARTAVDDLDLLTNADVVVGVGQGVDPADYPVLEPLRTLLGAQLAATRKVTDRGWLPHSRQVGITGLSLAPRLYVAIGTSGKFNHLIGVRNAGTIVAIDRDPEAPVLDACDVGMVGDWRELVPVLADGLRRELDRATA